VQDQISAIENADKLDNELDMIYSHVKNADQQPDASKISSF